MSASKIIPTNIVFCPRPTESSETSSVADPCAAQGGEIGGG